MGSNDANREWSRYLSSPNGRYRWGYIDNVYGGYDIFVKGDVADALFWVVALILLDFTVVL
jgi:hypothetical protein